MAKTVQQLADEDEREKFRLLAVAFTKMVSKKVLTRDDGDLELSSDEEAEEDDVHEMRAFMRMFMDLVGIFNEDRQNYSSGSKLDSMMRSTSPGRTESSGFPIPPKLAKLIEDWSTDEDIDDFDSDDEEEDDYDDFEEEEESRAQTKLEGPVIDAETRKRLKNAKKKADKRRKMKEKKQKEKAGLSSKAEETVDALKAHEEALR